MSFIRHWGSTAVERALPYPCDPLVSDADDALFRAIDIAAPPAVAFRWLCQLRAAPYSYDWIDNRGKRSPRELTPGLDELAAGQRVMRIFRLESFTPGDHLTLVLDDPKGVKAFGGLAVTYRVAATETGSRFVVKMVLRRRRSWLAWFLPLGDLVMMRKQLKTLKALAEA